MYMSQLPGTCSWRVTVWLIATKVIRQREALALHAGTEVAKQRVFECRVIFQDVVE